MFYEEVIGVEYEKVNKLIFEAFAEQHNVEVGRFMMEHFIEERKKKLLFPNFRLWLYWRMEQLLEK